MIIDIPEGKDAITYGWGEMVPEIGGAAATLSLKVYSDSTLGLREFEAARLRIAQINGCLFCQDWRTTDAFDERTRLAAEYAELYATDHHSIDDAFWKRMLAGYDQREIVELSMCLGSWLSFGRLNRGLGLDTVCVLPSHREAQTTS